MLRSFFYKQETSKITARFWQGFCAILKSRKENNYVDNDSGGTAVPSDKTDETKITENATEYFTQMFRKYPAISQKVLSK